MTKMEPTVYCTAVRPIEQTPGKLGNNPKYHAESSTATNVVCKIILYIDNFRINEEVLNLPV